MTTVTQGKFEWDDKKEKINIQKHGRGTRPPCFENFP